MELAFLIDFVAPLALLVGLPVLLARLLAPIEGASVTSLVTGLFASPFQEVRPRRVPEEEPVGWRLDRLQPPRHAASTLAPTPRAVPPLDARHSGC